MGSVYACVGVYIYSHGQCSWGMCRGVWFCVYSHIQSGGVCGFVCLAMYGQSAGVYVHGCVHACVYGGV